MGNDYVMRVVDCLNSKWSVKCLLRSGLPITQSEVEKVLAWGKFYERTDPNCFPLRGFLIGDFVIAGAAKAWGAYMCFTYKDQEAILSLISDSSSSRKGNFGMVPVANFYKSSVETGFVDSVKDSWWSARLRLSSYYELSKLFRSLNGR
jgi:hypothetical protein